MCDRGSLAASAVAVLFACTSVAAADPRPLGQQWYEGDQTCIAQLGLNLASPETPDHGLYRLARLDWSRSELQTGSYPAESSERRRGGTVGLAVDIDATGRPQACRLVASSGAADLDAHACPHVLANTHFVPALRRDGSRVVGTLAMSLEYEIGPLTVQVPGDGPAGPGPRVARPSQPVDALVAGLAGPDLPADVDGVRVRLDVTPEGVPAACLLVNATDVDALDKRICDELIARARFDTGPAGVARSFWAWVPLRP